MTTNRGFDESESHDKHNESDNKSIATEDLSTYFSDHKIVIPEIDKVFMKFLVIFVINLRAAMYEKRLSKKLKKNLIP